MKNLNSYFLVFLFLVLRNGFSQDIHFSQYLASPLLLNPALTGQFAGEFRFTSNYKNQWHSISPNCFKTFATSIDAPIYRKKIFTGLSFYNDKAGDSKMGVSCINLSLASQVKLNNRNTLTASIQPGWSQRSIDLTGVVWDNQYNGKKFDNTLASGEHLLYSNFSFFDFGAGLYWKYTVNNLLNFNAGMAGFHINRPRYNDFGSDRLNMKWNFHGGSEIKLRNSNTTYIPSIMILRQGFLTEINIGIIGKYNIGMDSKYTGANISSNVYFGLYHRVKDAFVFYTGYNYKNMISVGFSYDVNASKLKHASFARGGAELSLIYTLNRPSITIDLAD